MNRKTVEDLQGWASEKFGPETKLGKIARDNYDTLTHEDERALFWAREGWLVGLEEVEKDDSVGPGDILGILEEHRSRTD